MYAIVEFGGTQWKAEKNRRLRVPKLESEAGQDVYFEKVLLIADDEKMTVGTPFVPDAQVKAVVLAHGRAKKVLVFKKKRRKGYKVKNGHRQQYTEIKIDDITFGKKPVKQTEEKTQAAEEAVKPKPAPVKKESASAAPKATPKAAPKAAPAEKKTAVKTEAKPKTQTAKKTTAKKTETNSAKSEE